VPSCDTRARKRTLAQSAYFRLGRQRRRRGVCQPKAPRAPACDHSRRWRTPFLPPFCVRFAIMPLDALMPVSTPACANAAGLTNRPGVRNLVLNPPGPGGFAICLAAGFSVAAGPRPLPRMVLARNRPIYSTIQSEVRELWTGSMVEQNWKGKTPPWRSQFGFGQSDNPRQTGGFNYLKISRAVPINCFSAFDPDHELNKIRQADHRHRRRSGSDSRLATTPSNHLELASAPFRRRASIREPAASAPS